MFIEYNWDDEKKIMVSICWVFICVGYWVVCFSVLFGLMLGEESIFVWFV